MAPWIITDQLRPQK